MGGELKLIGGFGLACSIAGLIFNPTELFALGFVMAASIGAIMYGVELDKRPPPSLTQEDDKD